MEVILTRFCANISIYSYIILTNITECTNFRRLKRLFTDYGSAEAVTEHNAPPSVYTPPSLVSTLNDSFYMSSFTGLRRPASFIFPLFFKECLDSNSSVADTHGKKIPKLV